MPGQYQFYTVDSIDAQSWANFNAHPADRARRHEDYDRYITQEMAPFIRERCGAETLLLSTGVSMGGYHSANFFFRHPDIFDALISLSGLFQLHMFIGDYSDDNVYFNSPLHYLAQYGRPLVPGKIPPQPDYYLRGTGRLGRIDECRYFCAARDSGSEGYSRLG